MSYTVGRLERSITCKYSPRFINLAATQATAPLVSGWPPVERDPTPCKHYIFLSFRRGRGQLLVREHGTERVDVPGHPLPEGALRLLVALKLLALPTSVTTSSDVFEISGKVRWRLLTLGSNVISVIPGLSKIWALRPPTPIHPHTVIGEPTKMKKAVTQWSKWDDSKPNYSFPSRISIFIKKLKY